MAARQDDSLACLSARPRSLHVEAIALPECVRILEVLCDAGVYRDEVQLGQVLLQPIEQPLRGAMAPGVGHHEDLKDRGSGMAGIKQEVACVLQAARTQGGRYKKIALLRL